MSSFCFPFVTAPMGGYGLRLGPWSELSARDSGFYLSPSVRVCTNGLIICNHQRTGAAPKFSSFADKYQEVNGANHFPLKAPFLCELGFGCGTSFTQLWGSLASFKPRLLLLVCHARSQRVKSPATRLRPQERARGWSRDVESCLYRAAGPGKWGRKAESFAACQEAVNSLMTG